MRIMWTRRFVSIIVVVVLAAIGARLGVSGVGIYAYEAFVVVAAMSLGMALEPRIRWRRQRH